MRYILAATVLFSSSVAHAQTKLFVLLTGATGSSCTWTDCEPSYVIEIDVEGRRIVNRTIVSNVREQPSLPAITPDGRYLMWGGRDGPISTAYFSAFDNVARTTWVTLPLSAYGNPGPDVAAHPTRTRAYVTYRDQVRVLEPSTDRSFPAGCDYPRLYDLSGDGSRLMTHSVTTLPGTTRVFDSETGALLATLAGTSFIGTLNQDGTELISVEYAGPMEVRRYDVATGAVLQTGIIGAVGDSAQRVVVDPRTGRLYVSAQSALLVVDGSTLAEQARLPTALSPHVAFVADAPRAYVASRTEGTSPRPGTRITVLDTDRLVIEEQVDLPVSSGPAGLVVAPKPIAVQTLASQVSGQHVTLQW
ncbi:MAG: YncE family protein, partial [Vicinamibacterales bacterium]